MVNPPSPALLLVLIDDCLKTFPPPVSDEGYNVEFMIITPYFPNLIEDTTKAGISLE